MTNRNTLLRWFRPASAAWALVLLLSPRFAQSAPIPQDFLRGVDLSFIEQYEAAGFSFRENGVERDLFDILSDHGVNAARLRIWHTPADGNNTTEETLATALRIKQHDMHFLLDFHYSDFWADPGQQNKPAAWSGLSFPDLKTAVYEYTRDVITALNNQGTLPDMVQLGNEITPGMLWDDGRVGGAFNSSQQWQQFAELLSAAADGVNDSLNAGQSVETMIHIDRGGDNSGSRWFFDNLLDEGIDFDVIGLSFYPWWHGTLEDMASNINDLESRYGKDIIIVETGYPWTLAWNDSTHNFVGSVSQLLPGYPATVQGQYDYLTELIRLIGEVPNDRGLGFYYWAPEFIAIPEVPTPWENIALFDFEGEVLESIDAFRIPAEAEQAFFQIY